MRREGDDFIAILKYFRTEEGGRSVPAGSGYRPIVEFPGHERLTSGQQIFIDKEKVYPGETVKAKMKILSFDWYKGKLFVGQTFRFFEIPGRPLGTGEIIEILNKELEKKSN